MPIAVRFKPKSLILPPTLYKITRFGAKRKDELTMAYNIYKSRRFDHPLRNISDN